MTVPRYIADLEDTGRREMEGLTLLFHPRSGVTHILAPPSPEILDALAEGPADAAGLLARLRARFDFAAGEGEAALAARLDELEAAGLVRRA
jgi:PqqD family protein of HPr-rel-A system